MVTYRPICKIRLFSEKEEAFAYAEENNISISEDGYFTVFLVTETIKGVLVKEIFSENLEDAKEIKVINEKVNI